MRCAIVADIHGNLAAFEAVLEDSRRRGGIDEIWCLGDVVGYGPDPSACLQLLRQHPHHCVAGNHDWAAVGKIDTSYFNSEAAEACSWTAKQLSPEDVRYLRTLPLTIHEGDFTLVHGSPREPIWEYVVSVILPLQENDNRLIINCGGVGQPRDGDPRASYAIFDSDSGIIRHYRVEYDVEATQQRMEDAHLPSHLITRLGFGR
ncbi:MAG: metallophosphoesterase family protein [Chloroflexi bacterium]|nr:metallophosphoesterase family protein [Chloroflexota bacterium]